MSLFGFFTKKDKGNGEVMLYDPHPDYSPAEVVNGENMVRIMFMESYGIYLVHHYVNGAIDCVVTKKNFREAEKIAKNMLSGQKYIVV